MTRPPRFTIAALMGIIALCATAFTALRTSAPYWAAVLVSVTVVALLGSLVTCVLGRQRAGWTGFAIFGWGYFLLTFTSPFRDVVRPHLLTSVAIVESYRHVHPGVRVEVTDMRHSRARACPCSERRSPWAGRRSFRRRNLSRLREKGPNPSFVITSPGKTSRTFRRGRTGFIPTNARPRLHSHCSLPGWAGWWRREWHGEPRRRPPSSTHDAKEAAAIVSMTVHEGYLRLLGLRRLMLEHTTSASRCGRFGSGPTRVPGKSGPPRWRPITCSHSRNG